MDYYGICKRYYPKYYSVDDVKVFVAAGKITEEQFKEITGMDYIAPTN
jgi:uncharacterized XkdX family phage protein